MLVVLCRFTLCCRSFGDVCSLYIKENDYSRVALSKRIV